MDQRWIKSNDVNNPLDRFQYGYDRDSDRMYKDNLISNDFDELYHTDSPTAGYDNFNQLTNFQRGALSDSNSDNVPDTSSDSQSQSWDLDSMGNWESLSTDGGTAVQREHNKQNQVTEVGSDDLAFDDNGNTTTDENGNTLVYDAWNRLVSFDDGTDTVTYVYDALGRRVQSVEADMDFYYSDKWQVLEERVSGNAHAQYVWSPVYVDALIVRDRDADSSSSNGLEERLWVLQDANWNVTAISNAAGTVLERYVYDPYGAPTRLTASWGAPSSDPYQWVYLHQGGRYEAATGLYSFRYRDFSPSLGRWLQVDPIRYEAGDLNLYRYVGDNPSSIVDPLGLQGGKVPTGEPAGKTPVPWPDIVCAYCSKEQREMLQETTKKACTKINKALDMMEKYPVQLEQMGGFCYTLDTGERVWQQSKKYAHIRDNWNVYLNRLKILRNKCSAGGIPFWCEDSQKRDGPAYTRMWWWGPQYITIAPQFWKLSPGHTGSWYGMPGAIIHELARFYLGMDNLEAEGTGSIDDIYQFDEVVNYLFKKKEELEEKGKQTEACRK